MRRPLLIALTGLLLAGCATLPVENEWWRHVPGFDAALDNVVDPGPGAFGTLRVVSIQACGDWTPQQATTNTCRNMQRVLNRGLTAFGTQSGKRGSISVPDLAVAPGQTDQQRRHWSYQLRDDVRWSDGSAVTVDQVAAGIQALGSSVPGVEVTSVRAGSNRTIEIDVAQAVADLDSVLALPQAAPIPPQSGLTTGPFTIAMSGEVTRLVPNPYWEQASDGVRRPKVSKIEFRTVSTSAQALDEIAARRADVYADGSIDQGLIDAVVKDPAVTGIADNPGSGRVLLLGLPGYGHAAWGIDSCRQAVFSALDRRAVVTAFANDRTPATITAHPATALSAPTIASFDWSYEPFAVGERFGDVDAAKVALAKCGEDDLTATLAIADIEPARRMADAISVSLARVGITVKVRAYPYAEWGTVQQSPKALSSDGIDWVLMDRVASVPGVWGYWYPLVSSTLVGQEHSTNVAQFSMASVDSLLDSPEIASKDRLMLDAVGRTIDRLVLDSARYIPLAYVTTVLTRPAPLVNVTTNGALGNEYDLVNLGLSSGS